MRKELREKASRALLEIWEKHAAVVSVPRRLKDDLTLQGVAKLEDGVYMASFIVKTIYEMRLAIVFDGTQENLEQMIRKASLSSMWVYERNYYPDGPLLSIPLWYRENVEDFLRVWNWRTKEDIRSFLKRLRA